ncbi:MAG TPA: tyrosine-type recombinase/integrase [Sphingobacteriaceae bacterium]|nr:tyrosine-type recombinase/integrase [Sphingobacteriaceae bacterium]
MFIGRFIQYLQFEKRYSPHTISAYNKDLLQFSEFIAQSQSDIHAVSHYDIRSWMVELMDQKTDPKTINRKISTLRSFYKFLMREQLIDKDPVIQIKGPKVGKRLPVIIEEDKINSLLDQFEFPDNFGGLRDKLVIELLYGTGMRLAELVSLKESGINRYESNIRVLGKRSKERIIPLNKSLIKLLEQYCDEKNKLFDNEMLIVTDQGKKAYPKLVYRIVHYYLTKVSTQTKKSPHVLRHTFATGLLNNGADLNAIKELLGHSSLAATQIYTHNSVERLKAVYKQAHPKA